MFVNTTSGVRLNGVSSVVTADIVATNGVIHIVDAVIGLPTVVTHAAANPNFTTLVGLLSGQGLVPTLAGTTSSLLQYLRHQTRLYRHLKHKIQEH